MVQGEPDRGKPRGERLPATIDHSLMRIAGALERIAGDLERLVVLAEDEQLRAQRRLASLAQRLVDAAHSADERFAVADKRFADGAKYPREREVLVDWMRRSEDEAIDAWERLRGFQTRHPEVTLPRPSWEEARA